MDLPSFRTRFPEFSRSPDGQITALLDTAAILTPSGSLFDEMQGLRVAHMLAMLPGGRELRKEGNAEASPYLAQLQDLIMVVGIGPTCP